MGRLYGGKPPSRPTDLARLMDLPAAAYIRPYVQGRWYLPSEPGAAGAPGTNTLHLIPILITASAFIGGLAANLTAIPGTLAAAGHIQLALYANNPAAMRPTGAPLYTGSSITAAVGVLGTGSQAFSVAVSAGVYWLAINCDSAAVTAVSAGIVDTATVNLIGASTPALALAGASATLIALTFAQTYGTMPTFTTSSTFTESAAATNPLIAYQITNGATS